MTYVQLGVPIFLLLLTAVGNASAIYTQGLILLGEWLPTLIPGLIWMIILPFTGIMEAFFLVARLSIVKATKCILIWVSFVGSIPTTI